MDTGATKGASLLTPTAAVLLKKPLAGLVALESNPYS